MIESSDLLLIHIKQISLYCIQLQQNQRKLRHFQLYQGRWIKHQFSTDLIVINCYAFCLQIIHRERERKTGDAFWFRLKMLFRFGLGQLYHYFQRVGLGLVSGGAAIFKRANNVSKFNKHLCKHLDIKKKLSIFYWRKRMLSQSVFGADTFLSFFSLFYRNLLLFPFFFANNFTSILLRLYTQY